jgi:hypothetical protein
MNDMKIIIAIYLFLKALVVAEFSAFDRHIARDLVDFCGPALPEYVYIVAGGTEPARLPEAFASLRYVVRFWIEENLSWHS